MLTLSVPRLTGLEVGSHVFPGLIFLYKSCGIVHKMHRTELHTVCPSLFIEILAKVGRSGHCSCFVHLNASASKVNVFFIFKSIGGQP